MLLRDCLDACYSQGGTPDQCFAQCGAPIVQGDISVPAVGSLFGKDVPSGVACFSFWSCYVADVGAAAGNLPSAAASSVEGLSKTIGDAAKSIIAPTLQATTLPLALIVVGIVGIFLVTRSLR